MVSEVLLAECRKLGIKVFSADQGALIDMAADGADPTRTLIRQIMGALAQWEKTMLVNKLKVSRERIRSSGGRCEGRKPYGDRPGEKATLLLLCEWAHAGIDYDSMANLLKLNGEKNRAGKDWTPNAIRSMFIRKNIVIQKKAS
jgi:hypothetical protein